MDKIAGSGNDQFFTPDYAVTPLLKYISTDSIIWCPFDTPDSRIVKAFESRNDIVIPTHIDSGSDFFTTFFECDYIISNPPYSLKTDVFERLFSLGIPFAMLVGVVGLFESSRRFNMFKRYKFEIMWLSKRVAYYRNPSDSKPALFPPFSSVWLTSGILPAANCFEEICRD